MIDPEVDADAGAEDTVETEEAPEAETEEVDAEEATGDEPEAEESEEDPAPKRGETRQQKLANELRAEREQRIRAEAKAEALERSRTSQPDNSAENARIRAEKLALMDPTERKVFDQDETIKRLEQGQNAIYWQTQDSKDESNFNSIASKDTVQGRYFDRNRDRVNQELAKARQNGNWQITRGAIAALMFSQDAFNAKPSKKLAEKKAAAATRVATSKAAATSARSDVRGGKGGDESLADLKARILAREAAGDTR